MDVTSVVTLITVGGTIVATTIGTATFRLSRRDRRLDKQEERRKELAAAKRAAAADERERARRFADRVEEIGTLTNPALLHLAIDDARQLARRPAPIRSRLGAIPRLSDWPDTPIIRHPILDTIDTEDLFIAESAYYRNPASPIPETVQNWGKHRFPQHIPPEWRAPLLQVMIASLPDRYPGRELPSTFMDTMTNLTTMAITVGASTEEIAKFIVNRMNAGAHIGPIQLEQLIATARNTRPDEPALATGAAKHNAYGREFLSAVHRALPTTKVAILNAVSRHAVDAMRSNHPLPADTRFDLLASYGTALYTHNTFEELGQIPHQDCDSYYTPARGAAYMTAAIGALAVPLQPATDTFTDDEVFSCAIQGLHHCLRSFEHPSTDPRTWSYRDVADILAEGLHEIATKRLGYNNIGSLIQTAEALAPDIRERVNALGRTQEAPVD